MRTTAAHVSRSTRRFIDAAVAMDEVTIEEADALAVNDIMLAGLRRARASIDLIISRHTGARAAAL